MSILKGEFREVVHCGVSHFLNRENSVAQFESWEDVGRGTSGAMNGHRTCRGVPITQDELDTHYRALKKHTSLTKAKIGSGKVLFKDLREPIVVEYQGKVYMAAPFVPDTSVPDIPATWLPKPPSVAPPLTPKELLTRARELGKDAYGYGFGMHTHTQDLTLSVLCHNPEQEPSLVVKMIEAWKKGWQAEQKAATKPPRTPAPSVPAIFAPAPAATSDMASVPVRLGGGGIPPIPGMGAAAAPKPKRKTAAKPAAKPAKKAAAPKPKSKAKKAAAKPAKNGKTAAEITLTAAQKKRLAAAGSVTVKRDGKFVTVTR